MEPYSYKPLVLERNEIRVLKFVDPPTTSDPGIIHCILENVSLDDYLPKFIHFLETKGLECGPTATRLWAETAQSPTTTLLTTAAPEMPFARWRLDGDRKLDLDSFGVESTLMPKRVEHPQIVAEVASPQAAATPQAVDRDADVVRLPCRFTWGDFEAVSYCWYSDVRDKTVIVDGQPLAIATSLEAFLQKLRLLPEALAGMRFWADGICIWQDNTLEKNQQVKLMKRIYTHAYSVVVWLGPLDGDPEAAMKVMAQTSFVSLTEMVRDPDHWWARGPLPDFWDEGSFEAWTKTLCLPILIDVLFQNYWQCMWIIQELALNQYLTAFLYGDLQFPRIMVWAAARFCATYCAKIRRSLWSNNTNSAVKDLWQLSYPIVTLFEIPEYPKLPELDQILDLSRKASVKESQDKIYGMLGLLPSPLVKTNEPNYSLNQIEVYQRFARSLILYHDDCKLDTVFSWCSFSTDNKGPSWVPDWTQEFTRNHIKWLRERQAAKDIAANISVSLNHRALTCTGIIVDSIRSTSRSPRESLPFRTQQGHTTIKKSQITEFGIYTNLSELKNALTRTLAQDHPDLKTEASVLDIYWIDWNDIRDAKPDDEQLKDLWYGLRNITTYQENYSFNWWEAFDRFRHTNADFEIFGHQLRDFFPNMREYVRPMSSRKKPTLWNHPDNIPEKDHYQRDLNENDGWNMSLSALALVGRRLVTTDQGYLGLAAEAVQEGDVVAILCGCSFPTVLRRAGDSFVYIGECYVDGLMNGEAIAAAERGEHEFVPIDIV